MGKVIRLDDYRYPWHEKMTFDSENATLQVYVNEQTGESEVVQMNDDGEAIRSQLSKEDTQLLAAALVLKKSKASK